ILWHTERMPDENDRSGLNAFDLALAMAEPDPLRPMRDMDRAQVEALASGIPGVMAPNSAQAGQARYELLLRDRKHAEEQGRSRRDFESALADKQLSAATDVAKATKWAAWAAAFSAAGAIVTGIPPPPLAITGAREGRACAVGACPS